MVRSMAGKLLVLASVCALGVLPASATAASQDLVQPCGGTSWVGGSTDVCSGVVTYRDYVYDDEGADAGDTGYGETTQTAFGTLPHPAGDQRYAADDTNSADLVRLEL